MIQAQSLDPYYITKALNYTPQLKKKTLFA